MRNLVGRRHLDSPSATSFFPIYDDGFMIPIADETRY